MSWDEIKYSLNSKLGTADFKPIDRMLYRPGKLIFTANGSFTVPDGVDTVFVSGIGAGGDGSAGNYSYRIGGSGGKCGAFTYKRPVSVTPGEVINYTVGTGNTVFKSVVLAKGGNPSTLTGNGGAGGDVGSKRYGASGQQGFGDGLQGGPAGSTSGDYSNPGENTVLGAAGGGGGSSPAFITLLTGGGVGGTGGAGGSSNWYINSYSPSGAGSPGSYGSGGGGGGGGIAYGSSNGSGAGGAGGTGLLIVEW